MYHSSDRSNKSGGRGQGDPTGRRGAVSRTAARHHPGTGQPPPRHGQAINRPDPARRLPDNRLPRILIKVIQMSAGPNGPCIGPP
ncbi:hypothetical protein GCM10017744_049990 [Streptomyces antimycoticus]|uniref:Uncharacterized protein n=1 Tax=Streptomyces antimycoticus TaxID=68175 RepID=A0A4D4KEM4_9ACTN|nr:hypothetical protein SANT12839_052250 [Streptomyces antimycoticus]